VTGFLIDCQCPQCGAPATLAEADRLFACGYCRSRSYLIERNGFRYRFEPTTGTADTDLLYVPYWRFKGMLFSCTPSGIQHRFVDMSLQASPDRHFPVSLGLRSQALRLAYAMPDTPGRFMPPELDRSEMLRRMEDRFRGNIRGPVLHHAEIGESVSLIYVPYRVNDRIVDAITGQSVSPPLTETERSRLTGGTAEPGVRFLSTLCPHCGWDMEGARDARLVTCPNCRSAWVPSSGGFKRMNTALMEADSRNGVFLPFWRIQAEVDGIALESYADLVREANLPRVARPGWDDQPFRFWIPAFKIRPSAFLRIAQALTLGQPQGKMETGLPEQCPAGVNLPYAEALESLKIIVAGLLRPRSRLTECLPDLRIRPRKILLTYLPFSNRPHEYVQESLSLAVRKSHLATAGNL
jgi:DNA-directed RNA polymerase subunit RPC12/RpoP